MKGLDSHQLCSVVRVRIGVSETTLGAAGEDILCAHCRCVLEPDELSSMMGRKSLPTVQEDLLRSTESISTLKSDCTVETGQEFVMFDAATPDKSKDLGATEAVPSPTTSTLDDPGSEENVLWNATSSSSNNLHKFNHRVIRQSIMRRRRRRTRA